MKLQLASALLFSLLLSACSEGLSEIDEHTDSPEPSVDTSSLGTPEGPTSGVQDHELYFAVSENGEDWEFSPDETILEMASVPNLLLLEEDVGDFEAGTLISHFVDASEMHDWGDERIGYISSEDNGETWSDRELITIEDKPEELTAVDPCVVQLSDGRLRLYFFDFSANKDLLAGEETDPTFYSAVSEDGLTFEFEGEVYSSTAALITDPEVLWYEDRWLMYNPVFETAESMQTGENSIQISESEDGTDFEYLTTIDFQGIPGVMEVDGEVSLFGCTPGGITRVTSTDGIEFDLDAEEVVLQAGGCDPDPVQLPDGSYAMMTKHMKMQNTPNDDQR